MENKKPNYSLSQTEKGVVATLSYYEALGSIPLTLVEIQRYLMHPNGSKTRSKIITIHGTIQDLIQKKLLIQKNGFYALAGSDIHSKQKTWRFKHTASKWKRFRTSAWFLPYIPYVQFLGIMGSIATNNAKQESDIDILVGSSPGKIWTTRLMVTIVSQILRTRRHGEAIENRLCFNQYISGETRVVGAGNIASNQISSQFLQVWGQGIVKDRNGTLFTIGENRILLAIKKIIEIFLNITLLGNLLERGGAFVQIRKININQTGYPKELPQVNLKSSNLIFYYPKITSTEQRYRELISQYI